MFKGIGGGRNGFILAQIKGQKKRSFSVRKGIFGVNLCIFTRHPAVVGMFAVPNLDRAKNRKPAPLKGKPIEPEWQIVPDVFQTLRQAAHTLAGYDLTLVSGEKPLIGKTMFKIMELNMLILDMSHRPAIERDREEINRLIRAIASPLRLARNATKKEARKHLQLILLSPGETSLRNPGAARARTVKAGSLLEERLDEISRIEPRMVARQRALLSLLDVVKITLFGTRNFLDRALLMKPCIAGASSAERLVVGVQCEFFAQKLEQFDFRPYRGMCFFTAKDLRHARVLLCGNLGGAEQTELWRLLTRIKTAITIKEIQLELERVNYRLMRSQHGNARFDDEATLRELKQLKTRLSDLDESTLKIPVCKQAISHLQEAVRTLEKEAAKTNLEALRDTLTRASACI